MAVDDASSAPCSSESSSRRSSSPNSTTALVSHLPAANSSSKDAAAAEVLVEDAGLTEVDDIELHQQTGWHSQRCALSLPEAHATIKMPAHTASPWRMVLAFAGCGTIISVGYM